MGNSIAVNLYNPEPRRIFTQRPAHRTGGDHFNIRTFAQGIAMVMTSDHITDTIILKELQVFFARFKRYIEIPIGFPSSFQKEGMMQEDNFMMVFPGPGIRQQFHQPLLLLTGLLHYFLRFVQVKGIQHNTQHFTLFKTVIVLPKVEVIGCNVCRCGLIAYVVVTGQIV